MRVISHYRQTGRTTALCQLAADLMAQHGGYVTLLAPNQMQADYANRVLFDLLMSKDIWSEQDVRTMMRASVRQLWPSLARLDKLRSRRAAVFVDNWDHLNVEEQMRVVHHVGNDIVAVTVEQHARVSHVERGEDKDGPYWIQHFEPVKVRVGDAMPPKPRRGMFTDKEWQEAVESAKMMTYIENHGVG